MSGKLKELRKKFLGDFLGPKTLSCLVGSLFKASSYVVKFILHNKPKEKSYILALWHAHQCCLYPIMPHEKVYVMVSNSKDGDIIAWAIESMGFKTVRGSKSRHGISAAKKMIEVIEQGNIGAITVDGPRGPKGIVHKGVISIAKQAHVPIIPVVSYSPQKNFLEFKTWDEFRYPLGICTTVVNFGEPIFVDENITDLETKQMQIDLAKKLQELYEDVKVNYYKYKKEDQKNN